MLGVTGANHAAGIISPSDAREGWFNQNKMKTDRNWKSEEQWGYNFHTF